MGSFICRQTELIHDSGSKYYDTLVIMPANFVSVSDLEENFNADLSILIKRYGGMTNTNLKKEGKFECFYFAKSDDAINENDKVIFEKMKFRKDKGQYFPIEETGKSEVFTEEELIKKIAEEGKSFFDSSRGQYLEIFYQYLGEFNGEKRIAKIDLNNEVKAVSVKEEVVRDKFWGSW